MVGEQIPPLQNPVGQCEKPVRQAKSLVTESQVSRHSVKEPPKIFF